MKKSKFCIWENKGTDQLLYAVPLLSKSEISSVKQFSVLYSSVCVRPVLKPHCRFSHDVAHI